MSIRHWYRSYVQVRSYMGKSAIEAFRAVQYERGVSAFFSSSHNSMLLGGK